MPSDAFMELQDPAVWGETTDEQYGMEGRALGAFEITSFDFQATTTKEDDDGGDSKPTPVKPVLSGKGAGAASTHTAIKQFTIRKYIDKASPDLLMACCRAGLTNIEPKPEPIKWAIVSIRESGDVVVDKATGKVKANPWLVIEFRNLWVDSFVWAVAPGGSEPEETVIFRFESILIKYCRQDKSGAHARVKIKGFNRSHPEQDVTELDPTDLQQEAF
jgi:type VI protein secretion system component Hcp